VDIEFHIIRPWWLLALLPLLLVLWGLRHRPASESAWRAVCDPHLLKYLLVGGTSRRKFPLMVLASTWALAVVSLAGPTWSKLEQPVFQGQDATVLVLDLSLSMDARDVRPSRLTRARYKVLDILQRSRDRQTGLIVFAHDAFALSPLTNDSNTLAALVPVLDTNLMPGQGSQLTKALQLADELLYRAKAIGGEIIVIGDGVAQPKRAVEAAQSLARRGRTLSVLGVGTLIGSPVPLLRGGFLKDVDGTIVVPKLEVENLTALAHAGGGRYVSMTANDSDLDVLLGEPGDAMFGALEETVLTTDQWREDGIWIVLVLMPFAAFAFRRGWILAALVVAVSLPPPVMAFGWEDLWSRRDELAAAALQDGRAATAADLFRDPAWRGAAHYQSGQYQRAVEAFASLGGADAHYNRANALAKSGDLAGAVKAYDKALKLDTGHADATFNKTLIEDLLRQLASGEDGAEKPQGGSSKQEGEQRSDQQTQGGEAANNPKQDDDDGRREEEDEDHEDSLRGDDGEFSDDVRPEESELTSSATEQARAAEQGDDDSKDDDTSEQQRSEEQERSNLVESEQNTMSDETAQSLEQWLRRIPDDPGGLLRAKFAREYRRRLVRGEQEDSASPW